MTALRLADLTHPDDVEQDRRHYDEALRDALPLDGWIKRYLRPDGGVVWAHVSGSMVRGPDGAPLYLVGVIQDVTERIEAQQALDRTQSRPMDAGHRPRDRARRRRHLHARPVQPRAAVRPRR